MLNLLMMLISASYGESTPKGMGRNYLHTHIVSHDHRNVQTHGNAPAHFHRHNHPYYGEHTHSIGEYEYLDCLNNSYPQENITSNNSNCSNIAVIYNITINELFNIPTQNPTLSPTQSPTLSPTQSPTQSPTLSPTLSPEAIFFNNEQVFESSTSDNNKSSSSSLTNLAIVAGVLGVLAFVAGFGFYKQTNKKDTRDKVTIDNNSLVSNLFPSFTYVAPISAYLTQNEPFYTNPHDDNDNDSDSDESINNTQEALYDLAINNNTQEALYDLASGK